eukprot:TRINITY_DN590_c0_g4_i1.p1 TRINITY_DN590_c0_g4~~TRINITY_DN590_c0_g4_i1.p1  ORF type:complete len:387 (+),score=85.93 TRINITY_DN590_c0_g4_i1:28-1161(+)
MNKSILVVFAIIAVQLVVVSGHGWLTGPVAAGYTAGGNEGNASPSVPCGKGMGPTTVTVAKFTNLMSNFTNGGGHPNGKCNYTLATDSGISSGTVIKTLDCPSGKSQTAKIFMTQNPGNYYVQWHWGYSGGNWYGCFPVTVTAAPISSTSLTVGQSTSGSLTANTDQYWDMPVPANNFVTVTITGPSGAAFGVSTNNIPTSATADSKLSGSGLLTLCSSSTATATAIIGAFPGSASGSYSLNTATYNGLLLYKSSKLSDSISSGYRIYGTDSYDTTAVPKRVVARRTGGNGGVALVSYGTDCGAAASAETPTSFSSDYACVAAGSNNARKFYGLYTDSGAEYTINIEDGTCASVNSSVAVQASFLVAVLSLLISVLF